MRCPPPGLACRLGRWSPVATVQRRPKWQRRPVRGRAPLALAHPLPRPDLGDVFYLSGAGGRDKSIISFQRGAWRPPLWPPHGLQLCVSEEALCHGGTKGGSVIAKSMAERAAFIKGGSQRGRLLTCRFGRSLDAPHRGAATPFGIRLYKTVPLPYFKGTDYSFCPLTGGGRGVGSTRVEQGCRRGKECPQKSRPACGEIPKSS